MEGMIFMATQQEVIKKFMKSLDTTSLYGETALNAAVKSATNSKFTTIQSVIDQMVSDCKSASSADDFLKNYCGIVLDNTDTGAITGSDAGGSKTKTAESVIPESGSLKSFTGNSFTVNGLTFTLIDGEDMNNDEEYIDLISYDNLNSNEKYIWQSLYTWWGNQSLNLISDSYGSNFGFSSSSSATIKEIYFGFYSEADGTGAYTAFGSSDNSKTISSLYMNINEYNFSGLDYNNDSNGQSSGGYYTNYYFDRCFAHELTHAVMAANINYFSDLPQFIKEGMAEVTHGADDVRASDIQRIAGNYYTLQNALDVSDKSTGTVDCYAAGYMFLRYLAKQGMDTTTTTTSASNFTNGNDFYKNTKSNVTLNALGGKDTVDNYGASNVKIYGGSGNDSIISEATCNKVTLSGDAGNDYLEFFAAVKNSKIYGGAGKDSIYTGAVNATINGDAGNDYVYVYANGKKNLIYGGAGNDKFEGGGQNSTINGGAGNDYYQGYSNDVNLKINGDAGNDKIYDGGVKSTVNCGAGNDYVYLYTNATKTKVNGGAGKDSIYSGATKASLSGGAGNDYFKLYVESTNPTVYGGTGNDTIENYTSSKTVYVYKNGDGKDVIDGFNFGTDRIKITSGSVKSAKTSGSDVILTIGKGSIRIKDGKGKKISVINASGKTKTYKVGSSNTSSVGKVWFDDSDSNSDIYGQTLDTLNPTVNSAPSSGLQTQSNILEEEPPKDRFDGILTPNGRFIQKTEF